MSNGLGEGLLGLGLAFLVAVALVPLGIRLAWRLGVVDHPVGDKIHARPTPLMGGAAMAASFLVVTLLFPRHWPNPALVGLLAGCALATLLGIADELWSLPAWKHFLGQVGVVLVAIVIGFPRIQGVSNPLFTTVSPHHSGSISLATLLGFGHAPGNVAHAVTLVAGILFTVFWIVGMMNTVNFLDGLDGLAGGVAAIAALFLGLWAWHMAGSGYVTHDEQNVILPLILCGALLGFLVYNWAPARVFMGDSGAMFIGFALGALSIFGPVKLGTALLLLIVPIVDVAWAIVRRLLGRRSFASGDKHHIYHRMLELGMARRSVVLAFYALCIALGVLDLLLVKKQKLAADAVVALLAAAGAVALEVRGRRAEARTRRPGADCQLPTTRR
jgi:UDP-GlcNAc:undecaprenyl-phosphate GlcNAc-1-phosphate transferase